MSGMVCHTDKKKKDRSQTEAQQVDLCYSLQLHVHHQTIAGNCLSDTIVEYPHIFLKKKETPLAIYLIYGGVHWRHLFHLTKGAAWRAAICEIAFSNTDIISVELADVFHQFSHDEYKLPRSILPKLSYLHSTQREMTDWDNEHL